MAVEETRAESAAHGTRRISGEENAVMEFVRNSPFLLLSLGFHLVVLLLLAFITAQEPQPPQEKITVKMEEIQSEEMKPQPVQHEKKLSTAATSGAMSGRGSSGEGESHNKAAKSAESVQAKNVNVMGMQTAVSGGNSGDFEGQGGSGFELAAGKGRGGGVAGAVDKFAVATINAIANGKTLVVLMIDRSRSVIYGDLPQLIDRMNHYFDEIDKNLPVELTGQGRWQVVSYGRKAKFRGQPSANLNYVKQALASVEVDGSGVENVASGVNLVLDRFADSDYENILIACMTDECGDDVQDPVVLERTTNRMRKNNARFFVFGYEAVFAARKKRVRVKLDEELMDSLQGDDRAALRGFEGATLRGTNDAGPAAPREELWWGNNWHRWRRWGATLNGIRSGFGMYALNRMTLATHGTYFVMEKESDFDMDKMFAKYFPDVCSKFKYDKRMKQVALRRTLKETWEQIGRFYLGGQMRRDGKVNENLRMAKHGRQYCIKQAKKIHNLINSSKPRGENWTRWVAHAELTRAELLRLRFMLGQYYMALSAAVQEHGLNLRQRKKRYLVRKGKAPVDYKGPKQAEREYNLAKDFIQICIERHKNTPWEVLAKRMKRKIFPWRVVFKDLPPPSTGGGGGGPNPPSLAF